MLLAKANSHEKALSKFVKEKVEENGNVNKTEKENTQEVNSEEGKE